MKETKIPPLESEWNRHKQAYSMWIGITEEVKNKRSMQHNWIQPSFKVGNRQTTYVERQDKDEAESMTNNLQ